jgi:hypothetical protein
MQNCIDVKPGFAESFKEICRIADRKMFCLKRKKCLTNGNADAILLTQLSQSRVPLSPDHRRWLGLSEEAEASYEGG